MCLQNYWKFLRLVILVGVPWISGLNKSLACHEAWRQLEQSAILFCLSRVIPTTVFTGCILNNWWLMFQPVSLHQSQWCCADYISGSDKGLRDEMSVNNCSIIKTTSRNTSAKAINRGDRSTQDLYQCWKVDDMKEYKGWFPQVHSAIQTYM